MSEQHTLSEGKLGRKKLPTHSLSHSKPLNERNCAMYAIYRLKDPRDDSIFYIGQTIDVYKRLIQHINCEEDNYLKNRRIYELKALNLMVIMEVIELVDTREEALARENYWIAFYLDAGYPLTNMLQSQLNTKVNRGISQTDVLKQKLREQRRQELVEQKQRELALVKSVCLQLEKSGKKATVTAVSELVPFQRSKTGLIMQELKMQELSVG